MKTKLLRLLIVLATFPEGPGMSQNLLTNGNFTAGNVGFLSGYAYVASGESVTPGTCAIRTNSQDFNPGYALFYDHTTGNGNMLLLDGSPGTTTIAWAETVAVQANSQYAFSGWATASDPFNVPTLQFSINGIQVGTEIILSTNAGQWQPFLSVWNSGATNSATLSVVDENPMGFAYGNDFALDDFSFSPAAPSLSIALSSLGNSVIVAWPDPATNSFTLQQNANLADPGGWTTSAYTITPANGTNSITMTPPAGNRFFRLKQ